MAVVQRTRHVLHSVRVRALMNLYLYLTTGSYVENTLEHNRMFDAQGLISKDPSPEGRLRYWDNELCKKQPHLFDFAITVSLEHCMASLDAK